MRIFGAVLLALAVAVFYGAFFKLAPWLVSLIPIHSDWYSILKIVIYIGIGYLGGIGVPLALVIWGFIFLISPRDDSMDILERVSRGKGK